MSAKSVEADGTPRVGKWWSIPQAIVWIVGRDLALAKRGATVSEIDALETWEEMPAQRTAPPAGELPISLAVAPAELLRVAIAGQIEIRGHYRGVEEAAPIPIQTLRKPALIDRHPYGPVIVDAFWGQLSSSDFWANLWIDADRCIGQWPPLEARHVNSAEVKANNGRAASRTTRARRKPGVAEKDNSVLMAKVRRAMGADKSLTRHAAVRQHCGETTQKGIEAAYKRISRKINSGNTR